MVERDMGKKEGMRTYLRFHYLILFIIGVALLTRVLVHQNILDEYKSAPICDDLSICRVIVQGAVVDYKHKFSPVYTFRRYGAQQVGGNYRYFVEITYLNKTENVEIIANKAVYVGRVRVEIWRNIPTRIEKMGVTNLNPEIELQFAVRDFVYFLALSVLLSLLAYYVGLI